MLSFIVIASQILHAQEMVLVGSTIRIVDQDLPIVALEAKEILPFTASDWWEQLPFFRETVAFPLYSEEKIFQEKQLLSEYFSNLGYRDVEIRAMTVLYQGRGVQKGPKGQQSVIVNYNVHLGDLWFIDQIEIVGANRVLELESLPDQTRPFSRALQDEIHQEILSSLAKAGYANATVSWQTTIVGENRLALKAVVNTGRLFTFGRVEFQTWDGRASKAFIKEYQWFGDSYAPQRIRSLEEKLYSLSLYEDVEIDQLLNHNQEQVDILVRLKPMESWELSPIVQIASESTAWSTDLGFRWKFKAEEFSVLGRHQVGYRNYPRIAYFDFSHQGLATWQELALSHPIFSSVTGEWFVETRGIAEAQIGFQDVLVEGLVGIRWKPTPHWKLETGFAWKQHYYLPMVGKEEMFRKWFGPQGLAEEIIQPELDLSLEYQRGEQLWMQLALVPMAWCNNSRLSSYHFRSEARLSHGDWTIRPRLQHGAVIWYDEPVDSLHNRFFLGGAQTVRGWVYRGVRRPKDDSEFFDVSRGGERMGMVSLETQYTIIPALSVLGFVDLGRVWEIPDYGEDELQNLPVFLPSMGGGLLFPSPVGDVILAPAWQLREPDWEHAPPRMIVHFYLSRELGR